MPGTAPVLQAQGTIAAVTTDSLTVTLPAHQLNDILIIDNFCWQPNYAGSPDNAPYMSAPSGWENITQLQFAGGSGNWDWTSRMFWKRAASSAETNPTLTAGTSQDTGADTCWAGRAYVIRNCTTTGTPYGSTDLGNALNIYTQQAAANISGPPLTSESPNSLAIQFFLAMDDSSAGTLSGWTAGTAATTTTGTDGGFQTFRKDNIAAGYIDLSAGTSVAPPNGSVTAMRGIVFLPVPTELTSTFSTSNASSQALATTPLRGTALASGTAVAAATSTDPEPVAGYWGIKAF